MKSKVTSNVSSVLLLVSMVMIVSCNPQGGPKYVGRWICPADSDQFFEIKENAGAFLVTDETGATYPASFDQNQTLVLSGVPLVGTLPLPIDLETDELICAPCNCKRLIRSEAFEAAEQAEQEKQKDDLSAQRQTVSDLRNVGTAMMSWLTDQVGAGAAGARQQWNIAEYSSISRSELEKLLVPMYIQSIPAKDGWGHPYEFYLKTQDFTVNIMAIRSPGRDGKFSGATYKPGAFYPENFDEDIIWSDGFFVQWPQGLN